MTLPLQTERIAFKAALAVADVWHKMGNDMFMPASQKHIFHSADLFSAEDFKRLDPRLPAVMDLIFHYRKTEKIYKEDIANMLHYWRQKLVTLPCSAQLVPPLHQPEVVIDVYTVNVREDGHLDVTYQSAAYVGNIDTGFYIDSWKQVYGVWDKDWLDTHYPGWLQRASLARDLEMAPRDISRLVFGSQHPHGQQALAATDVVM